MVGVRRAGWGPEGLSRQEQVMGGKRALARPGARASLAPVSVPA